MRPDRKCNAVLAKIFALVRAAQLIESVSTKTNLQPQCKNLSNPIWSAIEDVRFCRCIGACARPESSGRFSWHNAIKLKHRRACYVIFVLKALPVLELSCLYRD
jgi:hypothetical protein